MLFDPDRFLSSDWGRCLGDRFDESFWEELNRRLEGRSCGPLYPAAQDVFRAFELTPFDETKVVVVGQDPYHRQDQADGLCFSVRSGPPFPGFLRNIFKELNSDKGCPVPPVGSLDAWARQGVLMLNAMLTVCAGKPGSHSRLGWEDFTAEVIRFVNERNRPVFILWGCKAHRMESLLASSSRVIRSSHPSPLAAHRPCRHAPAFLGSRPFSQADALLRDNGEQIDWCL